MKFLAIVFLLFFKFTFLTYANEVVYIDMSYILSNSNHGKSILDELEKKNKNNIKELELKEKIIKDLEKNISNQRNILSKNEFEKKINDLKTKVKVFRNDKDKLVKEFNNLKNNEIKNFMKNVEPLVSEYIKTNSINIVLDKKNVIIGKKDLDITYEILEVVNKNIK
jgi:outer membrane protein|tara:strand:- start:110 stop:610 length:501 start_codon:yes stop_codon:yes gene_type:complete